MHPYEVRTLRSNYGFNIVEIPNESLMNNTSFGAPDGPMMRIVLRNVKVLTTPRQAMFLSGVKGLGRD